VIVKRLIGYGWAVSDTKSADGTVVQRALLFTDQQNPFAEVIEIPLDLAVAEDMGGQLQGQPPRKHVHVAAVVPNGVHKLPRR
jgi:hypothetical protein